MGTIYLLTVLLSFVCIFYGTRKQRGSITIVDICIGAVVSLVPMINLVMAFYVLLEAKIFRKKIH